VEDRADLVLDRDPALPLPAGSELSACADLEEGELLLQRATLSGQHDAGADVRHPDAGVLGGHRCRLPSDADLGEEAAACRAGLVEDLVAPVAVEADGRTGHEDRGRLPELGQRAGQQDGALGPAAQDLELVLVGPAMVADASAGQVHDAPDALQRPDVDRAAVGVPPDLVAGGLAPHEANWSVAGLGEDGDEGRADEPRRT
jgi:hypothetical protein